jgi:hypothetical protein
MGDLHVEPSLEAGSVQMGERPATGRGGGKGLFLVSALRAEVDARNVMQDEAVLAAAPETRVVSET